jgi:hypothetical protein
MYSHLSNSQEGCNKPAINKEGRKVKKKTDTQIEKYLMRRVEKNSKNNKQDSLIIREVRVQAVHRLHSYLNNNGMIW